MTFLPSKSIAPSRLNTTTLKYLITKIPSKYRAPNISNTTTLDYLINKSCLPETASNSKISSAAPSALSLRTTTASSGHGGMISLAHLAHGSMEETRDSSSASYALTTFGETTMEVMKHALITTKTSGSCTNGCSLSLASCWMMAKVPHRLGITM